MINWIKGVFIHKKNHIDHFPIERYTGMFVTGYVCHGCGYEWYETKNTNVKIEASMSRTGIAEVGE